MKSRIGKLVGQGFYLLSIIALLVCIVVRAEGILYTLVLLWFLIGAIVNILLSRCPHCHRIGGLRLIPINKTSEQCRLCGETVEYK